MTTEIIYGRIELEGFGKVGYATFTENGNKVELIAPPFKDLIVRINDKAYKPGEYSSHYVMIWTRVAGWLGRQDFANRYFNQDKD